MKLTIAFVLLTFSALPGLAQKLSADLLDSALEADVIVQYKSVPGARHARRVQELGGSVKHRFEFIQADHITLSRRALVKLAEDPDVVYISPNYRVAGTLEFARPAIQANIAYQYGFDGSGVGVAIIDSGVAAVDDLAPAKGSSRVVYREDFTGTNLSMIVLAMALMSLELSAAMGPIRQATSIVERLQASRQTQISSVSRFSPVTAAVTIAP